MSYSWIALDHIHQNTLSEVFYAPNLRSAISWDQKFMLLQQSSKKLQYHIRFCRGTSTRSNTILINIRSLLTIIFGPVKQTLWISLRIPKQFSTKICWNNRQWLCQAYTHFPTRKSISVEKNHSNCICNVRCFFFQFYLLLSDGWGIFREPSSLQTNDCSASWWYRLETTSRAANPLSFPVD